ncbi:MAG: hypothetical protein AAFS02_16605 [Pseudomonadota bacterium]
MTATFFRPFLSNHWFLVAAPVVLVCNALVAASGPIDRVVEFAVLFDLIVLVPSLYLICYRKRKSGTAVRAVGLACLGVWVATKLIPEADQVLLVYLAPLRYVGLAVLILLELAVIRLIFRMLSSGDTADATVKRVADTADMPAWVAKLLVWEAGVWRRLLASVRRLVGRRRDDD